MNDELGNDAEPVVDPRDEPGYIDTGAPPDGPTRLLTPVDTSPERAETDVDSVPPRRERTVERTLTAHYRRDLDWAGAQPTTTTGDAPLGANAAEVGAESAADDAPKDAQPEAKAPEDATSEPATTDPEDPSATDTTSDGPSPPDRGPSVRALSSDHPAAWPSSEPIVVNSTTRGHVVVNRDRELERQEHLATVGRMRRLMPLATVLWLGFFFVDWVLATMVVPAPLLPFLLLRLVGVVPILASWWRLSRKPIPGRRTVAGLDLLMTTSSASILAVMCLLSGGLTSPYATYIAMVLAGRAASMPDHWRTGMVRLGVPAMASPVVLAIALPLSPALQAQILDASARGTYFFYFMLIGGAWGLLVISGHNAWALRRQVFRSRSIGRYRLERRIGEGGMGEVWVAWDDQLRRDVALKILRPEAGTQASAIARFEREIMATAGLSHPNTVRIFDHGVTDDGLWYYAMELLDGVDLHDLVSRDGPMSPEHAVHVARQAAGALAEAHRRGIVHRDLKPENIFVANLGGEPNFVKVLDFGIARLTESDEPRLTGTGWVAGTPTYVSPEVAAGGDAGPPADVYGLGGLLYFAVTGTPPFEAHSSAKLLQMHVSADPEPPSERRGQRIPALLEQTILRCLAKPPRDRYENAGELAAALDECLSSMQTLATTTEPTERTGTDDRLQVPRSEPRRTAAYER